MEQNPKKTRERVVSALSDAMFVAPALHSAGTFARRRNNTFFYHFNHQTKGGMYSKVCSKYVGKLSTWLRKLLPTDIIQLFSFVYLDMYGMADMYNAMSGMDVYMV